MKKMMLLASVVGLVALMLAAAPAFADPPGCDNPVPEEKNPNCDNDRDNDNGDDNDINSRLINRLNNVGNLEVSPTFEASQETEQDCDTGDVSQPISVDSTGDNSVTTVGLNPSANTGCAQTALGVLDFDPTLAVQGGDFAFNADQFNVIQDNDCDGGHDEDNFNCDDNGDDNGDHNGDHNGDDNGDEVNINDRDNFRFGGDRQIVHGGGGLGDLDIDDFGSSITMDGGGDTIGGGEVNQAASAANTTTQVFPWWPVK